MSASGRANAARKALCWTGVFHWPDGRECRLGNVITVGYHPQEAKEKLIRMADRLLAPGHELGWWGRGRLEYIDEGEPQ